MQTPQKSISRNGTLNRPHKTSPDSLNAAARRRPSATGSQSNSPASSPVAKPVTFLSPRAVERKSPKGSDSEKRLNHTAALESQVSLLEEDLKKAKDALELFESQTAEARKEAKEAKEQLAEARSELEHMHRQLQELSECEDQRIQELRKIGQERDKAWQSELEAVQKQHAVESTALLSSVNELQRLRIQCDMLADAEAAKTKLAAMAKSELQSSRQELEDKETLVEMLRTQIAEFEKSEAEYQESINVVHLQLEMSKNTIGALRADVARVAESRNALASELEGARAKVRSLEEAQRKLELPRSAGEGDGRDAELEKELEAARAEITELKAELRAKRTDGGKCLTGKVQILTAHEKSAPIPGPGAARDALEVAVSEGAVMTEDAGETIADRLKAALEVSSEREMELQKVRVQLQQWRKAAEVAAAIIASGGGNGTAMERTESFDLRCDGEEGKKNNNMLKKIGVMLKKGQK